MCKQGIVEFKAKGHLSSGIVTEEWTADHCGIVKTYSIRYRPSPNGGTRFRIEDKDINSE